MNIVLLKNLRINPEFPRTRTDKTHRRLSRLFHDIAKMTGQREAAFTRHQQGFDHKHNPTVGGPRKTGCNPDLILSLATLGQKFNRP